MKRAIWMSCILVLAILAYGHVGRAQSQAKMTQQAVDEAAKADKAMNAAYKELMLLLDAEGQEKLKTAQRAWIKFRDAECALAADAARGGSLSPQLHAMESLTLTEARTSQLNAHARVFRK